MAGSNGGRIVTPPTPMQITQIAVVVRDMEQALKTYTPNTVRNIDQLLADLRAIRKRGYSVDNEEIEIGLRCVGAPVKDYTGAMIAAISVAAPSARLTNQEIRTVGRLVMEVAAEISQKLGYEESPKSKALRDWSADSGRFNARADSEGSAGIL